MNSQTNLGDVLGDLRDASPKIFTIEKLLSLAIKVFDNPDVYYNGIKQKDPYTPISKSPAILSEIYDFVRGEMSTCTLCNRCQNATRKVMPDGLLNAELFILVKPPDIIDDRVGIVAATDHVIKSTLLCGNCANFVKCYVGNTSGLEEPCSPLLDFSSDDVLQANLEHKVVSEPNNKILDKALMKKYPPRLPNPYLSSRDSWNNYLLRVGATEWIEPSRVYITSIIKCYSSSLMTTEEAETCRMWLNIERMLSQAHSTLAIGYDAWRTIWPEADRNTFDQDVLSKEPIETETWGRVLVSEDLTLNTSVEDLRSKIRILLNGDTDE